MDGEGSALARRRQRKRDGPTSHNVHRGDAYSPRGVGTLTNVMPHLLRCLLPAALLAASTAPVAATTIAAWDFSDSVAFVSGNHTPAASIGSGALSVLGMTPTTDFLNTGGLRAWRVRGSPSNGWLATAAPGTQGIAGAVSTVGFTHIVVSFDWWATNNAIKHGQFAYTLDGSTWVDFNGPFAVGGDTNAPGGDTWTPLVFDLSGIAGAADNANFGFRFTSAFAPIAFAVNGASYGADEAYMRARWDAANPTAFGPYVGTDGNWRFANFEVSGAVIPEPSTYALLLAGLSLAVAVWRHRRLG